MTSTCQRCSTALTLERRSGATVTQGPVEATAEPSAAAVCPRCGPRTAARRRALADAVDAALTERLPVAAGRRGTARCAGCATPLDLPMRATGRALTVTPPSSPPFTVTVRLPLVRCGGCGRDTVPPELAHALGTAVHGAVGTADIATGRFRRLRRRAGRGSRARPSPP